MKKFLTLLLFCSNLYAYDTVRPNLKITTGAIDPDATIEKICTPGYTKTVRNVSVKTKNQVLKNYHINKIQDRYEIDHLISLELGGSNDIENLWPESYTTSPFNAHKKDVLENKLHDLVCADKISLEEAQKVIVEDWVKAYHDYVLQH